MEVKKKLSALFLALAMLSTFISPISAENTDQKGYIREELKKYDVSSENIDLLIWKYENGIAWDSISDEFLDVKPTETINIGSLSTEITRYPDGSVSIKETNLGIEDPYISITSRSIGGGDFDYGSTGNWWMYTGATVRQNTILIKASFKIDYSGNQRTIAQINRVYDHSITIYGGSFSFESLSISNRSASSNKPATADLRFTHTMKGGGFSKTSLLRANIQGRNNVYSTYSY